MSVSYYYIYFFLKCLQFSLDSLILSLLLETERQIEFNVKILLFTSPEAWICLHKTLAGLVWFCKLTVLVYD